MKYNQNQLTPVKTKTKSYHPKGRNMEKRKNPCPKPKRIKYSNDAEK